MNQFWVSPGCPWPGKACYLRETAGSGGQTGCPEHLVGGHPGANGVEARRRWRLVGERHLPPAADALAERAQSIDGGLAVPPEPAALALGRGVAALAQCSVKVPSRCSSAFEVFCAAGSELPLVVPGAGAYG